MFFWAQITDQTTIHPKQTQKQTIRRMKELLGVDVPSDKEGVLQDVHWGVGGA